MDSFGTRAKRSCCSETPAVAVSSAKTRITQHFLNPRLLTSTCCLNIQSPRVPVATCIVLTQTCLVTCNYTAGSTAFFSDFAIGDFQLQRSLCTLQTSGLKLWGARELCKTQGPRRQYSPSSNAQVGIATTMTVGSPVRALASSAWPNCS